MVLIRRCARVVRAKAPSDRREMQLSCRDRSLVGTTIGVEVFGKGLEEAART